MKDIKDILLERRIKKLEIDGKQVPNKYIEVFNSYLEQIAESLSDYDKQVRKEVVQEIIGKLCRIEDTLINLGNGKEDALTYFVGILEQIQGETNG